MTLCVRVAILVLGAAQAVSAQRTTMQYSLQELPPIPGMPADTMKETWRSWFAAAARVPSDSIELKGNRIGVTTTRRRHLVLKRATNELIRAGQSVVEIKCLAVSIPDRTLVVTDKGKAVFPPPATSFIFSKQRARTKQAGADPLPTVVGPHPMVWKVLNRNQAEALRIGTKESESVAAITAPTVISWSGMKGSVSAGAQRPFVTGFKFASPDAEPQPQIENITTGLDIETTGLVISADELLLNCSAVQRSISDVSTNTFAKHKGKELTVQIPDIKEIGISGEVKLKLGESLLVGGMPSRVVKRQARFGISLAGYNESEEVHRTWILITPSVQGRE